MSRHFKTRSNIDDMDLLKEKYRDDFPVYGINDNDVHENGNIYVSLGKSSVIIDQFSVNVFSSLIRIYGLSKRRRFSNQKSFYVGFMF